MSTRKAIATDAAASGRIAAVANGIVDVVFETEVPRSHDLPYAGDLTSEVTALIGHGTIRAMAPVRGLGLGMPVNVTGGAVELPVAETHRAIHQLPPKPSDRPLCVDLGHDGTVCGRSLRRFVGLCHQFHGVGGKCGAVRTN